MLHPSEQLCQVRSNLTISKELPVKPLNKPVIVTNGCSDELIYNEAMRALIRSGRVFVSSGRLCRLINGEVSRLTSPTLRLILCQSATWVKVRWDGSTRLCPVPPRIVSMIRWNGEWPGLPVVPVVKGGGR